jgi:DNA-binding MarR family transcriptional regulator
VVFAGPIKLGDLARAEQVKPPTMTKLVRALESARLVTRKVDAVDGRVAWITATEKGKELLKKGRARRVHALAARVKTLSEAQVQDLDHAAQLIQEISRGL